MLRCLSFLHDQRKIFCAFLIIAHNVLLSLELVFDMGGDTNGGQGIDKLALNGEWSTDSETTRAVHVWRHEYMP